MTKKLLLSILLSPFFGVVLSSYQARNILADAPTAYFGFHFMLPFQYHNALDGTDVLQELKQIFGHSSNSGAPQRHIKSQSRYGQVILKMTSLCKKYYEMNLPSPNPSFAIDEALCATLRPKMLHMYDFLSFYLPDPKMYLRLARLDAQNVPNLESDIVQAFYATIYAMQFPLNRPPLAYNHAENDARTGALLAISDMADTLENNLTNPAALVGARIFLEKFKSSYLLHALKNIPYTMGLVPALADDYHVNSLGLEVFQECHFTKGFSFSECSSLMIDYQVTSVLGVTQLIHHYCLLQTRTTLPSQRFQAYILKNLVNELELPDTLPSSIKADIKKNLLSKVPLTMYPTREDALGFRMNARQWILPDIFDIYLKSQYPKSHTRFVMHQLIAETGSYLNCKAEPLISPSPQLAEFTVLYNNFTFRLFSQKTVIFSLYEKFESMYYALNNLLKEVPAYNGTEMIIECVGLLIEYYERVNVLTADESASLKQKIRAFYHPQYFLESSNF